MTLAIFFMGLLFAGLLWFVGAPLFLPSVPQPRDGKKVYRRHLESRKSEVVSLLKDLTLDRDMKKMSETEYRELYDEVFAEGTRVMKEIHEAGVDAPATVSAPVQVPTPGLQKFCTHCGSAVRAPDRFCAQCGEKLHAVS